MKIIKTKIHGKMYDLTYFNHPGGMVPLYLINGKDGTGLFESYHPVSNRKMLQKILAKYEMKDNNTIQEQQIYDFTNFQNILFVHELKTKVLKYFQTQSKKRNCSLIEATKMTQSRKIEIGCLFFFFSISLKLFIDHKIIGAFLMPFSLWCLTVNMYHDLSHFAFSTNKYVENIIISLHFFLHPPFSWICDHSHAHHIYPNIKGFDVDLERYADRPIKKTKNTPIKLLEYIIFSDKEYDKYRLFQNPNVIFISQTIVYVFIKILFLKIIFFDKLFNYGFFGALTFSISSLVIFGLLFIIFTQINHIHINNFVNNRNFYKHQIITAHNVCTQSFLIRILSGGLNCQIEHHLFPSVNSCHLPALARIIKPLCNKYYIKYNESSSLFYAIYDTIKTIKIINNK